VGESEGSPEEDHIDLRTSFFLRLRFLAMHFSEIRQALRRLIKSRGFSLSVILTLALGIGATVSVFSVIHAVLITPLPYADPSRLFSIFQSKRANDEAAQEDFSPANFLDFRQQNHV
jgi:hypothetical protein